MAVSAYAASAARSLESRDRGNRAGSSSAIADINITPLVDVMLVLLVIFLLSMPVLTRTLALQLPGPAPIDVPPPPRAVLEVSAAGELWLQGQAVPAAQLAAALRDRAVAAPNGVLEIHASSEADYQAFAAALAQARASGIRHIAVAQ